MTNKPKSSCCGADMKVHSSDEGTGYYTCTKCGKACDIAAPESKPTQSWEGRFDKKFKGYWRGTAIADEIKFFIRILRKEAREAERAEIVKLGQSEQNNVGYKCAAGKIRNEDAAGYAQALSDLLTLINQRK